MSSQKATSITKFLINFTSLRTRTPVYSESRSFSLKSSSFTISSQIKFYDTIVSDCKRLILQSTNVVYMVCNLLKLISYSDFSNSTTEYQTKHIKQFPTKKVVSGN